MLRIITDGAADLPESWVKQYDIQVIPVNIQFGEKTYLQFIDLDNEGFFRMVEETHKIPKTSQPTPYQFSEFYKKHAQPGDTILSIHVTSKLSGTFNSAVSAAAELQGQYNVIPFDSATGSVGIGYMCREARIMANAGKSMEQIIARLEQLRKQCALYFTLDTLEYARMGGRVGSLTATVAALINLKPLGQLSDGTLDVTDKVRTRKAAIDRMVQNAKDRFGMQPVYMGVLHCRDRASADLLAERVKSEFTIKELDVLEMSMSLAANFGPGTLALLLYPVE